MWLCHYRYFSKPSGYIGVYMIRLLGFNLFRCVATCTFLSRRVTLESIILLLCFNLFGCVTTGTFRIRRATLESIILLLLHRYFSWVLTYSAVSLQVLFLCFNLLAVSLRYFSKPSGYIGVYDPAEIHNRSQLKRHMQESMAKLGYHLVFFFIYLYR